MNRFLINGRTTRSSSNATTMATTTCSGNGTPMAEAAEAANAPPANIKNTKSTVAASIAARINATPNHASHGLSAKTSMLPLPLVCTNSRTRGRPHSFLWRP